MKNIWTWPGPLPTKQCGSTGHCPTIFSPWPATCWATPPPSDGSWPPRSRTIPWAGSPRLRRDFWLRPCSETLAAVNYRKGRPKAAKGPWAEIALLFATAKRNQTAQLALDAATRAQLAGVARAGRPWPGLGDGVGCKHGDSRAAARGAARLNIAAPAKTEPVNSNTGPPDLPGTAGGAPSEPRHEQQGHRSQDRSFRAHGGRSPLPGVHENWASPPARSWKPGWPVTGFWPGSRRAAPS